MKEAVHATKGGVCAAMSRLGSNDASAERDYQPVSSSAGGSSPRARRSRSMTTAQAYAPTRGSASSSDDAPTLESDEDDAEAQQHGAGVRLDEETHTDPMDQSVESEFALLHDSAGGYPDDDGDVPISRQRTTVPRAGPTHELSPRTLEQVRASRNSARPAPVEHVRASRYSDLSPGAPISPRPASLLRQQREMSPTMVRSNTVSTQAIRRSVACDAWLHFDRLLVLTGGQVVGDETHDKCGRRRRQR